MFFFVRKDFMSNMLFFGGTKDFLYIYFNKLPYQTLIILSCCVLMFLFNKFVKLVLKDFLCFSVVLVLVLNQFIGVLVRAGQIFFFRFLCGCSFSPPL